MDNIWDTENSVIHFHEKEREREEWYHKQYIGQTKQNGC